MESKNTAKAIGETLPISTKQAVEICNLLRHKTTEKSKNILNQVIEKKIAVPFKRYYHSVGHKKGKIAAGRYPKKASFYILKLIESAEANAQNKGLTLPLIIKKILANKAGKQWHYGRQTRTRMKRTHVEIVVNESPQKEKKAESKKIVNNNKNKK